MTTFALGLRVADWTLGFVLLGFAWKAMCWIFENIWLHVFSDVSVSLRFCIRFTILPSKTLQHFKYFRDLIFSSEKCLCWCLSLFIISQTRAEKHHRDIWASGFFPLRIENNHKPAAVYCERLWIWLLFLFDVCSQPKRGWKASTILPL